MIITFVSVSAAPEKRTEVFQTLASLAPLVRRENGCIRCNLCQESGDDASFTIVEEWLNRTAFDEHLRSRIFGILLGLGPLLTKPVEVSVCKLLARQGVESVRRARAQAAAS
jgi:quinol monooxygenase YgiN